MESSETVTRSEAPEANWKWRDTNSTLKFFNWNGMITLKITCPGKQSNSRTSKDFHTKIQVLSRTGMSPDNNKNDNDNVISLPVPSQPADILAATSRPAIPILLQLRTPMLHRPDYHPTVAVADHIHPSNFLAASHHTHHYHYWTSSCCCHHDCWTNRCPVTRLIHRMNSASPLLLSSSSNHIILTISHTRYYDIHSGWKTGLYFTSSVVPVLWSCAKKERRKHSNFNQTVIY